MRPLSVLSLGNFFSVAHFYLVIYILAPYLATFMPSDSTGVVVSLGAVFTLAAFPFLPRLVSTYGARRLAIILASLQGVVLLWLASAPGAIAAVLLCALACATSPLIAYQLDLLLECATEDENATGRIRTLFLTAGNAALLLSPLITGLLLDDSNAYSKVFFVAALSLVPFIFLMRLRRLPASKPMSAHNVRDACLCILADKDLKAIAIANIALQFFFHLAPIYIPLYLHTVLGLPWSELGWIFAVMLVPYVLLEYPAGWLADRKFGDKALLILGFVILGASFASLSLIHAATPTLVILIILILTRVGAALVEAMTEGHFFRRVSEEDTNTVGIFRMMRPGAALVAPLIGTVLLSVGSYTSLFVITASITTAIGLYGALLIKSR